MVQRYTHHIPQNLSELIDLLGFMMLASPTFVDKTGYFPGRNIDAVFKALNESLLLNRGTLGEEFYATLREMSDRLRAHFEADPEDKTDDSLKGRALIEEMSDLLIKRLRRSRRAPPTRGA